MGLLSLDAVEVVQRLAHPVAGAAEVDHEEGGRRTRRGGGALEGEVVSILERPAVGIDQPAAQRDLLLQVSSRVSRPRAACSSDSVAFSP